MLVWGNESLHKMIGRVCHPLRHLRIAVSSGLQYPPLRGLLRIETAVVLIGGGERKSEDEQEGPPRPKS